MIIFGDTNINLSQQLLHALGGSKKMNAVDKDGITAVMEACRLGDIKSVRALHGIKADLNVCTKAGTAMHRAALAGQTDMLKVTPIQ